MTLYTDITLSGGSLTLNPGDIGQGITLLAGATLQISGGFAENTVINSGGSEYVNNGTIDGTTINGGELTYWGGVPNPYGSGTNLSQAEDGITFTGTGGVLRLEGSLIEEDLGPGIFEALPETPISGFAPGDTIYYDDATPSFDGPSGPFTETLTVLNGVLSLPFNEGGVGTLTFSGDNGDRFQIQGDAEPGLNVDEITFVACYAAGTRMRTPRGNIPIEHLQPGDLVHTMHRGAQPIRWIGQRCYAGRFIAGNHLALPIRIRRHAIARNIPSRDLLVSPDHAICEGGVLIPAWRLINGVSITQEEVKAVHYFHLELDRHDVIFAENTPAETFLDTGCRGRFQHAAGTPAGPGEFCLPRLEHGFHLHRIHRRIAARAGISAPPPPVGALHGYIDIATPTRIAGWARNETPSGEPVELEIRVNGQPCARILADRYRPDLRAAGLGTGCHAFEFTPPPGTVEVRRATDGARLRLTDAARAA